MKKKSKFGKKIVFILDVEPYSQQCIVVCNGTFGDAIKLFRKNKKNRNARETLEAIEKDPQGYPPSFKTDRGGARLFQDLPNGYVMMFNQQDSWMKTVGLIVHESLHLVHYVFRRARIGLTEDSEEAHTYLLQKIVEDICRKIY